MKRIVSDQQKLMSQELAYQKELIEATLLAEEKERKRIASELHDHFGVNLSTLKFWIRELEYSEKGNASYINKINQLLDRSIDAVRDLSHQISPPMLERFGLYSALQEIKDDLAGKLAINIDSENSLPRLEFWTNLQLYRICQEFIQNSLKYSKSDRVEIQFRSSSGSFSLLLKDFGVGFDDQQANQAQGLGIKTMATRCQAINAECKLRSIPNRGTSFLVYKSSL